MKRNSNVSAIIIVGVVFLIIIGVAIRFSYRILDSASRLDQARELAFQSHFTFLRDLKVEQIESAQIEDKCVFSNQNMDGLILALNAIERYQIEAGSEQMFNRQLQQYLIGTLKIVTVPDGGEFNYHLYQQDQGILIEFFSGDRIYNNFIISGYAISSILPEVVENVCGIH